MRRRSQAARGRHDFHACAPKRQTQQNPTAIGVTLAGERAVASTPRRDLQEPETGIEPVTSILPRLRSTTELLGRAARAGKRIDPHAPEVGSGGFEPPKAEPTDLQSVPFVHFGNCPDRVSQATPDKLSCQTPLRIITCAKPSCQAISAIFPSSLRQRVESVLACYVNDQCYTLHSSPVPYIGSPLMARKCLVVMPRLHSPDFWTPMRSSPFARIFPLNCLAKDGDVYGE